jgi:hypothetical protein
MEERDFAAMSKAVAQADTRRGMLRVLMAGVGTALVGWLPAFSATPVDAKGFGYCHLPGENCKDPQQCCSGRCLKGKCGCNPKGRPCINRVGLVCCSRQCRKGKCR